MEIEIKGCWAFTARPGPHIVVLEKKNRPPTIVNKVDLALISILKVTKMFVSTASAQQHVTTRWKCSREPEYILSISSVISSVISSSSGTVHIFIYIYVYNITLRDVKEQIIPM